MTSSMRDTAAALTLLFLAGAITPAIAQGRGQRSASTPTPPPQLGALAPENLKRPRPKAPFDLSGTWFVDLSAGFDTWRSGPPYPKFKGRAATAFQESEQAKKDGKSYNDWI